MIWKKDYDLFLIGAFSGLAAQAAIDIFSPGLSLSALAPMDIIFYLMMAAAFYIHGDGSGSQEGAQ